MLLTEGCFGEEWVGDDRRSGERRQCLD